MLSWVSSAEHHRLLNQMVQDRLGGLHSALVLMLSIEFGEFSRQERLAKEGGARGVILGCTEIPLLVKQADVSIPVFDTTDIHSDAAVRRALAGQ